MRFELGLEMTAAEFEILFSEMPKGCIQAILPESIICYIVGKRYESVAWRKKEDCSIVGTEMWLVKTKRLGGT
jgi:hypothetical protein